ncbi:endonuclease domain-containing protein [Paenibacillus sp. HWE-109]|uniref:endonuclease domain-containing protein n=1 Tax=Paenibacillus sp. HWE-109 TaxID=1306526 RepID=UPI001EDEF65B|nr:endonuclease domain-containing protein [Paenibacillus sp. HWE-109]UKS27820.1 endonuclease domain-containing protein [Paenibacillus sp. HWE-109]
MRDQLQEQVDNYVSQHLAVRNGERYRRLSEGHGYAERLFLSQIWLPAFGNFNDLHPEYEVKDFRDGTRFLDFAFLRHALKLAIEIDGYGSHSAQISRRQFSDQWIRQNHLMMDGWKILRFSFDDIKHRPRMCIQLLQQFMGRFFGGSTQSIYALDCMEKEIIRFTWALDRPLTPQDVCEILSVKSQKARRS